MKAKIICLIMILFALHAVSAFTQAIDPGTGTRISTVTLWGSAWSPDGKWIAGYYGIGGVTLVSAEGGSPSFIFVPTLLSQDPVYVGMVIEKPCFSPDGKEVLFQYSLFDKSRGTVVSYGSIVNLVPIIMAVDISTKTTRVVREEAEFPRYSHNGRYFAYVNYDHRAITDPANAVHHYSLAVYDTVTKETKYLTDGLGARTRDFCFSADDTYIAAVIEKSDYTNEFYRIPLDGGKIELISSPYNSLKSSAIFTPECSPDGRWIMYTVVNSATHQLFVYDTINGTTTPVFPAGAIYNNDGSWSPDGKKFCCTLSLKKTNGGGLYAFDFIENNLGKEPVLQEVAQYIPSYFGKQLAPIDLKTIDSTDKNLYEAYTILKDNQFFPTWSPDGKWIATIGLGSNYGWIIPSDGGVPINVADFSHAISYKGYELTGLEHPALKAFSQDSQEILYQGQIIDEARGDVVTITDETDSEGIRHFGWSITGPTILAMKAVNIYTGAIRTIMDDASSGFYSHNGKYFVYQFYPTLELILYDTETGQSRTLADKGTPCCFSGDDSYLLAYVSTEYGIIKIPLDGGKTETLIPGPAGWANLSPDDRFVLYDTSNGSAWTLSVLDMATGKSSLVMPFNEDFACGIGTSNNVFSPDGKKFCYELTSKGATSWSRFYTHDFNPTEYFSSTSIEASAPLVFALRGNYPNPFNPTTTIQFSLETAGKVNLSVYSAAGQKIRELVPNTVMTPGIHHVLWDGRDNFGKPVSSGVYLTRLHMGNQTLGGRMVLMK